MNHEINWISVNYYNYRSVGSGTPSQITNNGFGRIENLVDSKISATPYLAVNNNSISSIPSVMQIGAFPKQNIPVNINITTFFAKSGYGVSTGQRYVVRVSGVDHILYEWGHPASTDISVYQSARMTIDGTREYGVFHLFTAKDTTTGISKDFFVASLLSGDSVQINVTSDNPGGIGSYHSTEYYYDDFDGAYVSMALYHSLTAQEAVTEIVTPITNNVVNNVSKLYVSR